MDIRVPRQDGREQRTLATADVHDCAAGGPIVGGDHGGGLLAGPACHCRVEDSRRLGVLAEVAEYVAAENVLERGLAGAHAIE